MLELTFTFDTKFSLVFSPTVRLVTNASYTKLPCLLQAKFFRLTPFISNRLVVINRGFPNCSNFWSSTVPCKLIFVSTGTAISGSCKKAFWLELFIHYNRVNKLITHVSLNLTMNFLNMAFFCNLSNRKKKSINYGVVYIQNYADSFVQGYP